MLSSCLVAPDAQAHCCHTYAPIQPIGEQPPPPIVARAIVTIMARCSRTPYTVHRTHLVRHDRVFRHEDIDALVQLLDHLPSPDASQPPRRSRLLNQLVQLTSVLLSKLVPPRIKNSTYAHIIKHHSPLDLNLDVNDTWSAPSY